MAFDTDRIRQAAIEISLWLSGADASMAQRSAYSRCRASTVPDEPIVGSASSFGSVRLLCVSRDAANRWVCRAFARDTSGFLHFLSLVNERNQRISASCICVHVRILGHEGGTPLEDLRVSRFPRSLPKHPNAVAFLCPITAGNGFLPGESTRLRWLLHCAALPILFLLAASPGLALNTIEFHSPFKTGYDFWVPWMPNWSEHRFSLRYVPNNVACLWSEFALRRSGFSAANIFGTGTCFVPAFVLLTCVGLLFIRKGRFTFCALFSGVSFLAAALVYSVADIRLYLPLLLLLIAVAALPVTWAAQNLLTGKRIIAALVVFALFCVACVGYPSRSGYNTSRIDRSQAWDALQFATPPAESTWFIAQRRFLEVFGRQPGIVLSDIDPVYLNAFFPDWIVAAPLDWKHRYRFSRIWRYGPAEAVALVNRGLQESHAVYALFVSRREMEEKMVRLPHVDGYEWVLAEDPTAEAVILKLSPGS